ncbi:MAG: hypothetical protein M3328_07685, partial [Chloroflexota bacterium]|nr:hypothetical protein [Chloroflexota bacterium]
MRTENPDWHVDLSADDAEVYEILKGDRVWNCFAIANLAPPFRQYSQYAITRRAAKAVAHQGSRSGTGEQAACLILRHPQMTVISPYGAEAGVAEILAHVAARDELPERALLQFQEVHLPLLERYYRPFANWRSLLRVVISAQHFLQPTTGPGSAHAQVALQRLTPADTPALLDLYSLNPESTFRPDQLEHGVFYGVYD